MGTIMILKDMGKGQVQGTLERGVSSGAEEVNG